MHMLTNGEDVAMMNGDQVDVATRKSNNVGHYSETVDMQPLVEQHRREAAKRHQDFTVEDGVSLTKYPKLAVIQQSFEPKEGQSVSSSSDEFCDESSDAENGNQEENENGHPSDNLCRHSLDAEVQLNNEEPAAELDSDVDSVAISPQREILDNDIINRIEEKVKVNKLMLVNTALKIQNKAAHTSQFVPNSNNENNNINAVANLESNIKQSHSQQYTSDESSDEPVNVISIPENPSLVNPQEEYLHQEESDQTEAENNNDATGQEVTLQRVSPSYLYAVAAQSLNRSNLKIESSSSQDQSSQSSRDICQEQIDGEQSTRNQIYRTMLQSQIIDNQVPSTSRGFEENSYEISRTGSVSDLSLAHLVLSLKSDIQKLTEKVEKQEVILDAVIHANEVNISPLFVQSFKEKYNLKIPFTRLEDFLKFNDDLAADKKFCHEFTTSLIGYIDKQVTFAKNVLNMVKPYMSKDLALLFNASKPTPNKMVLKDTIFCKCLLQATIMTLKGEKLPLEHEKDFMKSLGHVISGARGWHNSNEE